MKGSIKMYDQADGYVGKKVSDWVMDIENYDREAQKWVDSSKKIVKRYKDERGSRNLANRYNILWSNVQTLAPSLYNKNPKPNVERRYMSDDPLGSASSQVLERCLSYFVESGVFHDMMKQIVLDRLLSGRGTSWTRYVPHFSDEGTPSITDDVTVDPEVPTLLSEEVVNDYVHWEDFGHTWARTWEEVDGVWRVVYFDKEQVTARFGEDAAALVPYDYAPKNSKGDKVDTIGKKTAIYEIWCKSTKKVYWLNKSTPAYLDVRGDPLRLKRFFPCPRPLFATLANDSCIPVPDYDEYRDQANELDVITSKIMSLTKALKVAGVYDSSAEALSRLLAEGVENQLIPVDNWAILAEKGGISGVVSFFPLEQITTALLALYQTRDKTKQDLYEITGISDIIRGASAASETATAQKIKGQFASLRLDAMQGEVSRFMRDVVSIMGEIIAEHFSLETKKQLSGLKLMTQQEKEQVMEQEAMAAQQSQMMGQPPQPPQPLPEKVQEMMTKPSWEEVDQLLRDDTLRAFKIDIQTDSTIKADQAEERDARIQFLQSVGGFMQQSMNIQNEALMPLLLQMMKFGMQGFKVGKELDATFDIVAKNLEKPKEPAPDKDMMQIQSKEKIAKMEADKDVMIAKMEIEKDFAIEKMKIQSDAQSENLKAQMNVQVEDMSNQKDIAVARMGGNNSNAIL